MIKHDEVFVCRAYAFCELAAMYCPAVAVSSAAKMLRKWIRDTRGLQAALEELGWRPGAKLLTPKMVACVTEFLGEP